MGCGGSKTKDDKPLVIFVLGGPGSGKGTQCSNIIKNYKGFTHLSTGDLLRDEVAKKGKNAEIISKLQAEGKLVSSEILVDIIKSNLKKGQKYLLDGFPRSDENDQVWNKIIGKDADTPFLLYFHCKNETMKERILGRAKTSGRSDDNEEAIVKRLAVFESQTIPIVEKYKKDNKVVQIDCEKAPDVVFKEVQKVLVEKKVV